LIDAYSFTLNSALSKSVDTNLACDTVFKIQDLANSVDFLGAVSLNMGFSLQTWDYVTIG